MPDNLIEYTPAKLRKRNLTPDQFLKSDPKYIAERFDKVIQAEGPIVDDLLQLRVLNSYGMKKRGCNLQPVLDRIMDSLDNPFTLQTDYNGVEHKVFWPEGVSEETYETFRATCSQRDNIVYYPQAELRNIFIYIKGLHPELSGEELLREAMDILGYKRKGAAIDATLNTVVERLQ